MPKYDKGTKVRVTFEAEVVNYDWTCGNLNPENYVLLRDNNPLRRYHALFNDGINQGGVKVEVLETPVENWPPQADDVWKSQSGTVYHYIGGQFHRRNTVYMDRTTAISAEDMKSRKPVLMWRKFA